MDYSTLLPQIKQLHAEVPKGRTLLVLIKTLFAATFPKEKHTKSLAYTYLTRLLWEYIEETLPPSLVTLKEPRENDPLQVTWKKRRVTQDLARAILDYYTIISGVGDRPLQTILSLGANQWKLAYVFLQQMSDVKYIVVDELSAIQTAHTELSRLFPEKVFFPPHPFDSYAAIQPSFERAAVAFLLPEQLPLLPDNSIDLGVAIDLLDHLSQKKTKEYFDQFSRLIRGYCYFKQMKQGSLREADYHVPDAWEEIFWRTCPLYPHSFEALFVQAKADELIY